MTTRQDVAKHRQARKQIFWHRRNLIEDLVGPKDLWPHAIFNTFWIKLQPNKSDRFKMTVFLLCNGVDPVLIKEYYSVAYIFNQKAINHVASICKDYPKSNWTAWNVAMGRSM